MPFHSVDEIKAAEAWAIAGQSIQELISHAHSGDKSAFKYLHQLANLISESLDESNKEVPLGQEAKENWDALVSKSTVWPVMFPADHDLQKQLLDRINNLPFGKSRGWKVYRGERGRPPGRAPADPARVAWMVLLKFNQIRDPDNQPRWLGKITIFDRTLHRELSTVEVFERYYQLPGHVLIAIRTLPDFGSSSLSDWQDVAGQYVDAAPAALNLLIPEKWRQQGKNEECGSGAYIRKTLASGLKSICPPD